MIRRLSRIETCGNELQSRNVKLASQLTINGTSELYGLDRQPCSKVYDGGSHEEGAKEENTYALESKDDLQRLEPRVHSTETTGLYLHHSQ